jgi:hypothetical protein
MKSKLIYLLHGGVLGTILVTTNTKDIVDFLSKSLTPFRYGLLVYEEGKTTKPTHMAVDEFVKVKKASKVKPKWKTIVQILIESEDAYTERQAKNRLNSGKISYNGQVITSPDFKVDMNKPGVVKYGDYTYIRNIAGAENSVKAAEELNKKRRKPRRKKS